MIYAFSGHPFLVEEAARAQLKTLGLSPRDVPRLGGEDLTVSSLEAQLQGGLFGPASVMVDLEGQKAWKELLDTLARADAQMVVLDPLGAATRVKIYEKHGTHTALPAPSKTGDVAGWVTARAKKQGLTLERDASVRLAEIFGDDLASIVSELNKLELVNSKKITVEDIETYVNLKPPGDSFALLEAATHGRAREALGQLERLLEGGEDPFKLMGAVVWQYNLIARCVALRQQNPSVGENAAAQALGVKPYPAKKALEVARKLDEGKVHTSLKRILQADFDMKRGFDSVNVLERLVLELSGSA